MTVGQRIKSRREQLGLTQEELAKKVGYKSRSSINKIELSRDLPLRKVERVAVALDTSPSYLMGWVENDDPNYDSKQLDNMYDTEDDLTSEALSLYERYQSASPEVRAAVEILLKSQQHDS